MKKLMLLSLLVLVAVATFAQRGGGDPEARIQKRVAHLTEELNLSADQQAQVKSLLETQYKSHKVDRKKGVELSETERKAMHTKRKAAKEDFDNKLANILTPEQNETYKSLKQQHANKRAHRGHSKGKGDGTKKTSAERTESRVAKMTEQLGLSAEQQKQMTELMTTQQKNRKPGRKIIEEMSEAEKATLKAEHKVVRQEYLTQLEEILTPEQLATYQKLKAERKEKRKMHRGHKRSAGK